MKWMWQSVKPGRTSLPCASMTFVEAPRYAGNLLRAAYRDNFVSADGERFRPGLSGIHGVNPGVDDHRVRAGCGLSPGNRRQGEDNKRYGQMMPTDVNLPGLDQDFPRRWCFKYSAAPKK